VREAGERDTIVPGKLARGFWAPAAREISGTSAYDEPDGPDLPREDEKRDDIRALCAWLVESCRSVEEN
jgi:hypothetical protein